MNGGELNMMGTTPAHEGYIGQDAPTATRTDIPSLLELQNRNISDLFELVENLGIRLRPVLEPRPEPVRENLKEDGTNKSSIFETIVLHNKMVADTRNKILSILDRLQL